MQSVDVTTIYEVPIMMQRQGMDEVLLRKLNLPIWQKPLRWSLECLLQKRKDAKKVVNIKLVGKYAELPDAYKSITESITSCYL